MEETKTINLGVSSKQKLFKAYVEFMQPALRIRNREADVFAQLLYLNDLKKDLKQEDRFDIIFSTKFRKIILSNLGIKDSILQNCFSELRKKRLIINNTIPKGYLLYPKNNKFNIVCKIEVTGG